MPEPRYDIVDRRGVLVGRLVMGAGEAIAGFGQRSVYVVHTDEDGAQWVRRHPWP